MSQSSLEGMDIQSDKHTGNPSGLVVFFYWALSSLNVQHQVQNIVKPSIPSELSLNICMSWLYLVSNVYCEFFTEYIS